MSSKVSQVIPFALLKRFETAEVVELYGDDCCVHRLEEIGIRTGARLCMLSPGSPCILAMDGRRISLRVDCDTEIMVEPTGMATSLEPIVGEVVSVEC